jgi:hypothetical protein
LEERPTIQEPRRHWRIRFGNWTLGVLNKLGIPRFTLDEARLLERAQRKTGLSNFGPDDFREPLRELLEAFDDDGVLTPIGRAFAQRYVLEGMENRLRIERAFEEHPEIEACRIERPLVISALPRTGTTLLYNLLAQDPAARPLLYWEGAYPAPLGPVKPGRGKRRMRLADLHIRGLRSVEPALESIYPLTADGPEECHTLLRNTFVSVVLAGLPKYLRWLRAAPEETLQRAYEHYRRQLQLLQWQRPPKGHWLLKSPVHVWSVGALLDALPDASIVQTHRDPCKVIPSQCSLYLVMLRTCTDALEPMKMGPVALELAVEAARRTEAARQAKGPDRFFDVNYARLVKDPMAVVREVYDHFGYTFTSEFEVRAQAYIDAKHKGRRSTHRYDLEQFSLTEGEVRDALDFYCRRYDVAAEG